MTATTAGTDRPGRTPIGLMADRVVGPFIVGKVLSACGHWAEQIAAAILMYQLTRSALWVGAVSAVQFSPQFVLALWAGALSDRVDRRRLLMLGRATSGLACLILAALVLVRGTDSFGGKPVLLFAVASIGIGHALSAPAMQALVHDLVPRRDLEAVIALNSVVPSLARTIGPAAGAGLLLLGGPGLAFGAAATAHLVFAGVLVFIRPLPYEPPDGRPSLLGGLRYLLSDRPTTLLLVGVVLVGYGTDPVLTLTPKLADNLNDQNLVGVFVSVFGVGAVVLAAVFARLRRLLALRAATVAGFLTMGPGLAVAGLVRTEWAAIIGFLVAGFGYMLASVSITTRIQRRIPDQLRGRIMALWSIAFLGSRPISAPINGAIADLTSVRTAILIVAGAVFCASLLARVRDD